MLEKYIPQNKKVRTFLFFAYDVILVQVCAFLALWVRFDMNISQIPTEYGMEATHYMLLHTLTVVIIFLVFHLYSNMWSVAGIAETYQIAGACIAASLVQITGMTLLQLHMPRSYYILYLMFFFMGTCLGRLSYRLIQTLFQAKQSDAGQNRIMVIGAGSAGSMIIKELQSSNRTRGIAVCVIDDDVNKVGKRIHGVPIMGTRKDIVTFAEKEKIEEIFIAMPAVSAPETKQILEICKETDCKLKILPGMYQLINGDISIEKLRNVEIEDLLGREPIKVNLNEIMGYVSGKVVLVTGGGGSIGSELCRQIASHRPKQLVIFDIYENNAYDIQLELKRKYPELDLVVLIGSVRNTHRINSVFKTYKPNIVYHAAAHKHVPLMEDSPNEAIKNNVFGTFKTATAAGSCGVEKFVLISTDKAVNPTNIMGASKRMCEMVIQTLNKRYKTEYVAVRFGNVLGSNGSVIPLFKRQIAQGGPVTVTHPDIIRYFMTIPEAVSLVLQAGAYAKGGEIFVLDMGEPMKIVDLARNLIRLSGYTPDEDIMIAFTGLRPGEKLYEELLMKEEGLQETDNKLIHIGKQIEFDEEQFLKQLEVLKAVADQDSDLIRQKVQEIVPTYTPK